MKSYLKLILLISLALISCDVKSTQKSEQAKDLLAFAPKESSVVIYSNVKSISESNIIKEQIDDNISSLSKEARKEYDDFIKLTGFNVEKDLKEILLAAQGKVDGEKNFIVIAKANYDMAKLIDFAKKKAVEEGEELQFNSEQIDKATLYTIEGKKDSKALNIAFLDDYIMIAKKEALKEALKQKESILDNQNYMAKLDQVNANHFFALLDAKDLRESIQANNPYKRSIDFLDNVAMAMSFDEKVHLSMISNCLETSQAEEVENIVRGILGMIRLGVSQERELIDLMNEVEIKRNGKEVKVNLDVDRERLEKLKNYHKKIEQHI